MNYDPNIVNVVYCCSDLFAEVCAVSIASLFDNNVEFGKINIYIIHDQITQINQSRIKTLAASYNQNIYFIPMPEPKEYYGDNRFTMSSLGHTYGRMIVGDLLPKSINRVLCLDSDMLILKSLYELWNVNLDDYYVAGVDSAPGIEMMNKTLHIKPGTLYCNGGLFLMNLEKIRDDKIEDKYKLYIKGMFDSGKSLGAYEEEVINKCAYPRILRLVPEYNLMTVNLVMDYKSFVDFRRAVNFYTQEEMDYASKNPVIIHAINTFYVQKRIWEKDSDSPYADKYLYYRAKTPWKELPQIVTRRSLKQLLMKKIWHIMPKRISFTFASFIRNRVRPLLTKKRDDE